MIALCYHYCTGASDKLLLKIVRMLSECGELSQEEDAEVVYKLRDDLQ